MPDPISYIKSSGGAVNAAVVDEGSAAIALQRSTVQVFEADVEGSFDTDIRLAAGVPVVVAVPEITQYVGNISVFISGHSSNSAVIKNSRVVFTPQNTGLLRVYYSRSTPVHIKVLVYPADAYRVDRNYSELYPQITTRFVLDGLTTYKNKNVPSQYGFSVDTFADMLAYSYVATISEPVLIRDSSGLFLYDVRWEGGSLGGGANLVLFDSNGVHIGNAYATSLRNLPESVADAYYAAFVEYSNYPGYRWVAMDIGDEGSESVNTYRVGQGGDWETFTDMLVNLQGNSDEKVVIVEGGVYDIYEEMGGDALIASIDDPSSMNWRDVCHVVPDNTTIIGEGRVTLRWMPSDSAIGSSDMAFLFSPLNVSGTCRIENIDIECQNCRYGIHDETSSQGQWDGAVHVFKNVRVKNHHGSYGDGRAYCAGHNRSMRLEFVDCEFDSSDGSVNAWSTHWDNQNQYGMSTFNFIGCKFLIGSGGEAVRFSGKNDTDNDVCMDEVKFCSCYIGGGKIRFSDENYNSSQPQHDSGYRVQLIGCNQVEALYDPNINEGEFHQFNTIGVQ